MSEVALLESIYNETEKAEEPKVKSQIEDDNLNQYKSAIDIFKSPNEKTL